MTTFIQDVLADLQKQNIPFSDLTFILPSKRAGVVLKHEIAQITTQTQFAPQILSIEHFVEKLSGLRQLSNIELLFEFYEVYLKLTAKQDVESFDSFVKWAQILLQDFNEIDRYLVPQSQIFDYLSAIQEINHWSSELHQTPMIKRYLAFWNNLSRYYNLLTDHLLEKSLGYQGLIYRESQSQLDKYQHQNEKKYHVFLGFNALNKAESKIIQSLLQQKLACIYWDTDKAFAEAKNHDASFFLNTYKKDWPYYKQNPFYWTSENYLKPKNIEVIGIPKNVGQAKYVGEILRDIKTQGRTLSKTAVVLGNEALLIPVLNSLPKEIDSLNITMGFPLNTMPLASLFEKLFMLHIETKDSFYYKDVISLLSHPFIKPLLAINTTENYADIIINHINKTNKVHLKVSDFNGLLQNVPTVIKLLFESWKNSPDIALKHTQKLILEIKNYLSLTKKEQQLSLEYLFRFSELINSLETLNTKYHHINSVRTLYVLFKELLSKESLDFQGEPLEGLQIMGMLESRVLDFETVIITSVNEGVLPSGKSNNSFIPYDVKIQNQLPTYKEKDAVYTYHFYRLIQRAKNVYILYNTVPDILNGGEKSRFITQLEVEGKHVIQHHIRSPEVPKQTKIQHHISKTNNTILEKLKTIADKGFSPSSLALYIRNPLDFYHQKILGIKEQDDVEETVAANTLGTVIHNTLEEFYKPLTGKVLTEAMITEMKQKVGTVIAFHFNESFKKGDITKGKNLITFEIAKRYVSNFLNLELQDIKKGNTIKIIAIETESNITIDFPELDFPINLTGKVDRVDEYNGLIRIIDYKSGKVEQGKVELINWEDITTDYDKYSKSFQILTYAYMMFIKQSIKLPIEAGIISFKNLNEGFLKFTKKDRAGRGATKETLINEEVLQHFEKELKKLILEICNPNIDFIEKDVKVNNF